MQIEIEYVTFYNKVWGEERLICVTYQHLLELLYRLIGNADAINLSDLISYMQSPWSGEIMN